VAASRKPKKRRVSGERRALTLKDRLSRLGYRPACRLLGHDGERLILQGGKYAEIELDRDVHLGDDLFRLNVDDAVVTITLMSEAKQRLAWN
jgi:hypothetical protein